MTDTPDAPDDRAIARLDPAEIAEALALRLDRTREGRENRSGLTGTGTSEDGLVAVTVDSRGRPTAISIDPQALHRPAAALADAVLLACQDAVRDLEQGTDGSPGTGRAIDSAQAMLAELGTEFREQATVQGADFDQLHRRLTDGR